MIKKEGVIVLYITVGSMILGLKFLMSRNDDITVHVHFRLPYLSFKNTGVSV